MKLKRTKVSHKYYTQIQEEIDENFHNDEREFELRGCSQACIDNDVACHFKECEHWISFGEDKNCDLISIKNHGQLTLRQVGDRLGVSYVRIKQIEDSAIKKIRNCNTLEIIQD